jgi:hypothetical protein
MKKTKQTKAKANKKVKIKDLPSTSARADAVRGGLEPTASSRIKGI